VFCKSTSFSDLYSPCLLRTAEQMNKAIKIKLNMQHGTHIYIDKHSSDEGQTVGRVSHQVYRQVSHHHHHSCSLFVTVCSPNLCVCCRSVIRNVRRYLLSIHMDFTQTMRENRMVSLRFVVWLTCLWHPYI
jgi:hypothetical protein